MKTIPGTSSVRQNCKAVDSNQSRMSKASREFVFQEENGFHSKCMKKKLEDLHDMVKEAHVSSVN